MILPVVVEVIVPVFGVVALGYLIGAIRWMDSAAVRGLSLYVFNIAIPLLLFKAMSTVTLPAQMPWGYVFGFFACALGCFLVVFWLMRAISGGSAGEAGIFAFGSSYGNFIPLGIPLVLTAFGEAATIPLFLLVAFQAPVFFAPMIIIQESAKRYVAYNLARVLTARDRADEAEEQYRRAIALNPGLAAAQSGDRRQVPAEADRQAQARRPGRGGQIG